MNNAIEPVEMLIKNINNHWGLVKATITCKSSVPMIIIRPHPKCAGKDIYRQLKKLNNNFIIDLNITFITSIDKSDIIISYGLTSLIDNYALWYNKKILLIYEQHCWEKLNHKKFKNTDKILNNKCCVIQHEKSIDILSQMIKDLK